MNLPAVNNSEYKQETQNDQAPTDNMNYDHASLDSWTVFQISSLSYIFAITAIVFGLLHLFRNNSPVLAGAAIIAGAIAVSNIFLLHIIKKFHITKTVFIISQCALLLVIILTAGLDKDSITLYMSTTLAAYILFMILAVVSIALLIYKPKTNRGSAAKNDNHLQTVQGEHTSIDTHGLAKQIKELEQAHVTLRKLLKDLNAEKAKDGAILSSIGEGVIVTDEVGKIMFINPKAESMLGLQLIEVIGKVFAEKFKEYDVKGTIINSEDRPIWKTLRTGQTVSAADYLYEGKDKTRFPVFTTVSPIVLNGKTIGAIDVFRDITREKDIDRMKTEFISLASHQLRTPLSAINWFLEILLGGDVGALTKEQAEIVDNIYQSNKRMVELVNSLLNVSRIESGRIIIDPVLTDVKELIEEVVKEVRPKLDKKNLIFSLKADADLPKIVLDPKLIRQVYLNLLTNSIKYTPESGSISITVTKNDNEIVSEVADTGYGIPEKDNHKVFSKFYRGENIVHIETEGNGLGLYLVKTIIESSKGKIWFNSEERKGTTFRFSLPLAGMLPKKGEVVLT